MYRKTAIFLTAIMISTSHTSHCCADDLLPRSNESEQIWEKKLSNGDKIIVERSVIRDWLRGGQITAVNYCFYSQNSETHEKRMRWSVDSFPKGAVLINTEIVEPELSVLDVDVVGSDFLVAYNLFGRMWAFRVITLKDGSLSSQPRTYRNSLEAVSVELAERKRQDKDMKAVTVAKSTREAKVSVNSFDQLQVYCKDVDNGEHVFVYRGAADGSGNWQEKATQEQVKEEVKRPDPATRPSDRP